MKCFEDYRQSKQGKIHRSLISYYGKECMPISEHVILTCWTHQVL